MGRSRIFFQAFLIPSAGADGIECPSGKRIGIHVSNYRSARNDQIPENRYVDQETIERVPSGPQRARPRP
jgi:hypothetical protein